VHPLAVDARAAEFETSGHPVASPTNSLRLI
jgi:hypothetical protein